jgi:integrase
MPKRTLTDRGIRSLKPAEPGQRYEVMDAIVPGLGIRVTDKGTKTFILVARFPGTLVNPKTGLRNPTRRALGEFGELALEQGRAMARAWLALIAKGIDPQEEEERQRLAEQRKRANSFASVAEDFIRDKLPGERRGGDAEADIRRDLIPAWGTRPITEITPHDVRAVIRAIRERGPYQAHNVLGHARRLFGWAIDAEAYGLQTSPCDRLKPKAIIGERRPRSRTFNNDEVFAYWRATARLPYPFGPLGLMLLLSGQRHSEVGSARWSEIDLAAKVWTVAQERFKSDVPHMVPLTDDMIGILAALPRFRGDHVFSTTDGKLPTVISGKIKHRIDARMLRTLKAMARKRGEDPSRVELRPFVVHDLRRVLRSNLSALRVPDHIAEMVIGHGRQGLQRVYDQHRYVEEMRDALQQWAARLRSIVEPPPANVVALRA